LENVLIGKFAIPMKLNAKVVTHRGELRIAVYLEKGSELISEIKNMKGSRWSQSMKVWHLPDTEDYRKQFGIVVTQDSLPSVEGIEGIEQFRRYLKSKRYSENTIKTYCEALKSFWYFTEPKPLVKLTMMMLSSIIPITF